jgi:hypothetical protein
LLFPCPGTLPKPPNPRVQFTKYKSSISDASLMPDAVADGLDVADDVADVPDVADGVADGLI